MLRAVDSTGDPAFFLVVSSENSLHCGIYIAEPLFDARMNMRGTEELPLEALPLAKIFTTLRIPCCDDILEIHKLTLYDQTFHA
jgi:hypothetical protein